MKHRVSDLGSWIMAAALLLGGPLAYAGSIDSDAGTRAFPSLKIGVGAEAVGMGEAVLIELAEE
ncbi:MAG: hypothetical protein QGG58_04645 [Chloroflexota bacterium]|nr:hypothetical protein [Chloroflexota bacterium]